MSTFLSLDLKATKRPSPEAPPAELAAYFESRAEDATRIASEFPLFGEIWLATAKGWHALAVEAQSNIRKS